VELRQLAQRITGRYHLDPLSKHETVEYVRHRLKVAGGSGEIFTAGALREVHRLSNGIPRIINVICDRALLGAFTQESHLIGPALVRSAASEVYGRPVGPLWLKPLIATAASVGIVGLAVGTWLLTRGGEPTAVQAATNAPAIMSTEVQPATQPVALAEPPPPSPAPSAQDIAEVLKSYPKETTTESAFAKLFSLWGGEFDPANGRPCDQATAQGLECVYQQGSWGQLRLLNRPAILTLIDDGGNAHQLVLSGLSNDLAKVDLTAGQREVSMTSISRYWYGDYLVLWRPPAASPRPLTAGMQGESVRWLRSSLSSLRGKPIEPAAASDVYDEELARLVEEFQREHRLNVDGIAGKQTQIVIDTLNNPAGAPLLIAQASDQGASL
jgi:general secretion pathway protein A